MRKNKIPAVFVDTSKIVRCGRSKIVVMSNDGRKFAALLIYGHDFWRLRFVEHFVIKVDCRRQDALLMEHSRRVVVCFVFERPALSSINVHKGSALKSKQNKKTIIKIAYKLKQTHSNGQNVAAAYILLARDVRKRQRYKQRNERIFSIFRPNMQIFAYKRLFLLKKVYKL